MQLGHLLMENHTVFVLNHAIRAGSVQHSNVEFVPGRGSDADVMGYPKK
jgi:hypothetical protein